MQHNVEKSVKLDKLNDSSFSKRIFSKHLLLSFKAHCVSEGEIVLNCACNLAHSDTKNKCLVLTIFMGPKIHAIRPGNVRLVTEPDQTRLLFESCEPKPFRSKKPALTN